MGNDQVKDEVVEETETEEKVGETKDDQPSKQSDEPDKEPTGEGKAKPKASKLSQLVKGLQKGYTLNRQEISEIKGMIEKLTSQPQSPGESVEGEGEEYVTVGKLKEILNQHAQNQANQAQTEKARADKYISDILAALRAEGKLKSKEESDDLMKHALDIQEPDLNKAYRSWKKVQDAKKQGLKLSAKKKARQEEGSNIGTSQKAGESPKGANYGEIHGADWDEL